MRKRFRGNQPISVSSELEGGLGGGLGEGDVGYVNIGGQKVAGVKKPEQMYGGKPAFETPMGEGGKGRVGRGEERGLGFDEDKTRGL